MCITRNGPPLSHLFFADDVLLFTKTTASQASLVDGILNHSRLSGIGLLELMGAEQVVFSEDLGGVILRYTATNGREDDEVENPQIPADTYVAQSA